MTRRFLSTQPLGLLLIRLGILAWAGFWTWFATCSMASDGIAWQPVLGLILLLGSSTAACVRPRPGGWLLAAFGVLTAWVFADATAIGIFSAPAIALGILAALCGAPRATGVLAT